MTVLYSRVDLHELLRRAEKDQDYPRMLSIREALDLLDNQEENCQEECDVDGKHSRQ